MNDEPKFEVGQVVVATSSYNGSLTKDKRYVVTKYEPRTRVETYTFPAYVTVIGDFGKPVTGHTYRFKAVEDEVQKLSPPDPRQCQALKPNGENFMTFGGGHKMLQCKERPVWLATENHPGKDGMRGSMTLCDTCSETMKAQLGETFATLEPLK